MAYFSKGPYVLSIWNRDCETIGDRGRQSKCVLNQEEQIHGSCSKEIDGHPQCVLATLPFGRAFGLIGNQHACPIHSLSQRLSERRDGSRGCEREGCRDEPGHRSRLGYAVGRCRRVPLPLVADWNLSHPRG